MKISPTVAQTMLSKTRMAVRTDQKCKPIVSMSRVDLGLTKPLLLPLVRLLFVPSFLSSFKVRSNLTFERDAAKARRASTTR